MMSREKRWADCGDGIILTRGSRIFDKKRAFELHLRGKQLKAEWWEVVVEMMMKKAGANQRILITLYYCHIKKIKQRKAMGKNKGKGLQR